MSLQEIKFLNSQGVNSDYVTQKIKLGTLHFEVTAQQNALKVQILLLSFFAS